MIRCISGLQHIDGGTIELMGKDISKNSVGEIREAGVACIPEDRYDYGCAVQADMIETSIMAHQYKPSDRTAAHSCQGVPSPPA